MSIQAPLIPGQFPEGYCYPSNPQILINHAFSLGHVDVPDNVTGIYFSDVDPSPDHTKPWFKIGAGRLYYWHEGIGKWVAKYPIEPGLVTCWLGTEAELNAYDNPGGSTVVLGAELYTGPFWEIIHDFDGRSPMGPGAIPGDAPNNRSITVGLPLGEGSHVQTLPEVAQHTHVVEFSDQVAGQLYYHYDFDGAHASNNVNRPIGVDPSPTTSSMQQIAKAAADAAVGANVVHPVMGIFFIRRTARIWYTT